jgi:AcrR family transcriptional regulator
MAKSKKSSGRPRSQASHQAMLQATLTLLAEVGYDRMSIDAIAARAGVGKTTIYRRYRGKEELVADAIETIRAEVLIPNTGSLEGDIESLITQAAEMTLNPVGRKSVAMIISSACSHPKFAQVYWEKYLNPRRQAFEIMLDRAKVRQEIPSDLDSGLVFDAISGIMLYALIFQPTPDPWNVYVRRALGLLFQGTGNQTHPNIR